MGYPFGAKKMFWEETELAVERLNAVDLMHSEMATAAAAESLQSCLTLCDPIPGILQARTLEWVAISFSNA